MTGASTMSPRTKAKQRSVQCERNHCERERKRSDRVLISVKGKCITNHFQSIFSIRFVAPRPNSGPVSGLPLLNGRFWAAWCDCSCARKRPSSRYVELVKLFALYKMSAASLRTKQRSAVCSVRVRGKRSEMPKFPSWLRFVKKS